MQAAASVFKEIRNDFAEGDAMNNLLRMGNMVGDNGVEGGATAFNNTMLQQFEGVQPRTFTFQWKLYAADAGQSAAIFQIIRLLKQASHPRIINPALDIIEYPSSSSFPEEKDESNESGKNPFSSSQKTKSNSSVITNAILSKASGARKTSPAFKK